MSDLLRSTLDDVSRGVVLPNDLSDAALRLAGRRRRRALFVTPAVALAGVVVLVVLITVVFSVGRRAVAPAGPVSGPGSVPSQVGAVSGVRSVFSAPIARAALMYRDRHGTPILVSADGDQQRAQRALRIASSGGYSGTAYALSPDGRKVAYAWQQVFPVGGSQPDTQLRVVTLSTGSTATLALPGVGFGAPVQSIAWSADVSQLFVQDVVTKHVEADGDYTGTVDAFLVDIASDGALTRGRSVDPAGGLGIDGWSSDGQRVLSVHAPAVRITDLSGAAVRTVTMAASLPAVGRYGNPFGEGATSWSPNEQYVAVAVAKEAPGRPLNVIDGQPRDFVLRAVSLTSSGPDGTAAEVDVELGSALDAYVIGWADDERALVGITDASGTQRVESIDIATGAQTTAVTFASWTAWAPPQIAGDVVRVGGFR